MRSVIHSLLSDLQILSSAFSIIITILRIESEHDLTEVYKLLSSEESINIYYACIEKWSDMQLYDMILFLFNTLFPAVWILLIIVFPSLLIFSITISVFNLTLGTSVTLSAYIKSLLISCTADCNAATAASLVVLPDGNAVKPSTVFFNVFTVLFN